MTSGAVWTMLAIASSSAGGLLAIWVGLGRGHWFLRVAAIFAVLGLLLSIPAHELAVVYAVQCLVVVPTLLVVRCRRAWREGKRVVQFTVLDILLLTAVVAVVLAVVMNVPRQVWESGQFLDVMRLIRGAFDEFVVPLWADCLLRGLFAGCVTLAAAAMVLGRYRRWLRGLLVVLYLTLPILIPVCGVIYKAIVTSSDSGTISGIALLDKLILLMTAWVYDTSPAAIIILWFSLFPMVVCLMLYRAHSRLSNVSAERPSKFRRTCRWAVASGLWLMGIVLLMPLLWAYYVAMTPPRIPEEALPEPNGYVTLARVANELKNVTVPVDNEDCSEDERATPQDFRNFAAKYHAALDAAHKALDDECRVPLQYDVTDLNGMGSFRCLTKAFTVEGRVALMDRDTAKASRYYQDAIRLGRVSAQGGLTVHWLVGITLENIAVRELRDQRSEMPAPMRRQWIAMAPTLEKTLWQKSESWDAFVAREEIWNNYGYGGLGRLLLVIQRHLGECETTNDHVYAMCAKRRQVLYRLLLVDLALAEYRAKHGAYPKELAALAPEVLKEIPVDPFSGKPLIYYVTKKGYWLYSVGENGEDENQGWDQSGDGDDYSLHDGDDIGFWQSGVGRAHRVLPRAKRKLR